MKRDGLAGHSNDHGNDRDYASTRDKPKRMMRARQPLGQFGCVSTDRLEFCGDMAQSRAGKIFGDPLMG